MSEKRNHNTPAVNLNLNVRGLGRSATLRINEESRRLQREGRDIFRFGLGQSPFPVPRPVVQELKNHAHEKDYLPVLGLEALRQAVARYYHRVQGVQYAPENIIVGPGSKELMFILQLVYYGDLVIATPSWVSYAPQAAIIGRQIRWLPTRIENKWRITPAQLAAHCEKDPDRPRLVILNYPGNPGGTTYEPEELEELAAVADRYRVLVLSDEIYGELHHEGRHVSIARYYPEGTILSGGLSKWCGAGGWRLGTFAFPNSLGWLREAMAVVASETYTSTSAPIQYAAVRAFANDLEIQRYLWTARRILAALGRFTADVLAGAGARLAPPEGGFYLFPDFEALRGRLASRGILTAEALCHRALEETGVAMLPGSDFGRPPEELTVRLAYVDFDGARAMAAAEQFPEGSPINARFLETYTPICVRGAHRLADWLTG